jgi:hypothetical protein
MVLSSMSDRVRPSPTTLKSSCASADNVGLIDGTAELTMEVCCDDRTHENFIGMLTEPTTVAYGSRGGVFNVRLQLVLFIERKLPYKHS